MGATVVEVALDPPVATDDPVAAEVVGTATEPVVGAALDGGEAADDGPGADVDEGVESEVVAELDGGVAVPTRAVLPQPPARRTAATAATAVALMRGWTASIRPR